MSDEADEARIVTKELSDCGYKLSDIAAMPLDMLLELNERHSFPLTISLRDLLQIREDSRYARIAELERGLEPFAAAGELWLMSTHENTQARDDAQLLSLRPLDPLTVGVLRAAARAMRGRRP